MKLAIASSAALLFLTSSTLAQTNEEVFAALNNLQHEMSRCIAYYTIVQECVQSRDAAMAADISKVAEHLVGFSAKLGGALGLTKDAMSSRINIQKDQMRALIRNDCLNVDSLFSRYALRCKQVVENGDSVLIEYLRQQ